MAKSREKGIPTVEMSAAFHEKSKSELEKLRENVAQSLKDDMISMLEDEMHTDLVITNGTDTVRAHKCIVKVRFKHLWQESWLTQILDEDGEEVDCVHLSGLTHMEMEDFLRQLYTVSDSAQLVEEYLPNLPGYEYTTGATLATRDACQDSMMPGDEEKPKTGEDQDSETIVNDECTVQVKTPEERKVEAGVDQDSETLTKAEFVAGNEYQDIMEVDDKQDLEAEDNQDFKARELDESLSQGGDHVADALERLVGNHGDEGDRESQVSGTDTSGSCHVGGTNGMEEIRDEINSDVCVEHESSSAHPDQVCDAVTQRCDVDIVDSIQENNVGDMAADIADNNNKTSHVNHQQELDKPFHSFSFDSGTEGVAHEIVADSLSDKAADSTYDMTSDSDMTADRTSDTPADSTNDMTTDSDRAVDSMNTQRDSNEAEEFQPDLMEVCDDAAQGRDIGSDECDHPQTCSDTHSQHSDATSQQDGINSSSETDQHLSSPAEGAVVTDAFTDNYQADRNSMDSSVHVDAPSQESVDSSADCLTHEEMKNMENEIETETDYKGSSMPFDENSVSEDKREKSPQNEVSHLVQGDSVTEKYCDITKETQQDENMSISEAIKASYSFSVPYETCSSLGTDLLQMHLQEVECDCCLSVDGVHFMAHKCLLSARSDYFLAMFGGRWSESKMAVVNLEGVSAPAVEQLLLFLYGGVMELCASCDMTELFVVADMYGVLTLKTVLSFYIKKDLCHFFHKPCQMCTTTAPEAVSLCHNFNLEELQTRCLRWVGKYFTKIWPTKNFASLPDTLHQLSADAIVEQMTAKNVLDVIMECHKLTASLPRIKWTENVLFLLTQLMDSAIEFTSANFLEVIKTPEFLQWAIVASWKASVLEEIFNSVIDSLPVDTACLVFETLLRLQIFHSDPDNPDPDVLGLLDSMIKRCEKFFRTHIHQVMRSKQWAQLPKPTQSRILETSAYLYLGDLPDPKPRSQIQSKTKYGSAANKQRPHSAVTPTTARTVTTAASRPRTSVRDASSERSRRTSARTSEGQKKNTSTGTKGPPPVDAQRGKEKTQIRGTAGRPSLLHSSSREKKENALTHTMVSTPKEGRLSGVRIKTKPKLGHGEGAAQETQGATVSCNGQREDDEKIEDEPTAVNGAKQTSGLRDQTPKKSGEVKGHESSSLPQASSKLKLLFSHQQKSGAGRDYVSPSSGKSSVDTVQMRTAKMDKVSPGRSMSSRLPTLIRTPKPGTSSRPASQVIDGVAESMVAENINLTEAISSDAYNTADENEKTLALAKNEAERLNSEQGDVEYEEIPSSAVNVQPDSVQRNAPSVNGSGSPGAVSQSVGETDNQDDVNEFVNEICNHINYLETQELVNGEEGSCERLHEHSDESGNCDAEKHEETTVGSSGIHTEVKIVKTTKPLVVGFIVPPD